MFVETLEAFFGAGLWAVIKAVLILLLAFIVSAVVKSAVTKLLAKTKLGILRVVRRSVTRQRAAIKKDRQL